MPLGLSLLPASSFCPSSLEQQQRRRRYAFAILYPLHSALKPQEVHGLSIGVECLGSRMSLGPLRVYQRERCVLWEWGLDTLSKHLQLLLP